MLAFLQENKDKKVSAVLDSAEFKELIEAKKQGNAVLKDANGNVTHIFCYYHKQWENVKEVEYGKKKNSHTGLNTMCKIGVNKWTKQQNDAKKAKAELLEKVGAGKVDPKEISSRLEKIEAARNAINMEDAPKGTKEVPKQ